VALPVTKQQSAQLRYLGTGPRFIRVTGRQIRYEWEIEAWCESRTVWRSDQRSSGLPRPIDDAHPSPSVRAAPMTENIDLFQDSDVRMLTRSAHRGSRGPCHLVIQTH
jgi:hypothetical protein